MHVAMRFVPSFEELRFDDARRRIAAPFPPASGGPHVAGSAPAASRDSARTVAPPGPPLQHISPKFPPGSARSLANAQGESFDKLVRRFGLQGVTPEDRRWAVRRWHALDPWPEVPAALERLHPRYVLATLSNGNVELLVNLARHAKLRFDTIFSAETFGHYKPDSETYLGAANLLGFKPGETMLVAAHESDLRAAAANGLRTAFVSRPAEYGPAVPKLLQLPAGFDHVVGGLNELVSLEL